MSTLTARHLKLTPIAAGLLALCALLFPAAAHAGTPSSSGNGGTYLCLYNDQNQCADLADNTQSPGQAIDTWSDLAGGGGNGLGWNFDYLGKVCNGKATNGCSQTWPFTNGSGFNNMFLGFPVYYIEKTEGSGHNGCLSVTGSSDATWQTCGADGTEWVAGPFGYWYGVESSDATGNVMYLSVQHPSDGAPIFNSVADSELWQAWGTISS
jgi:hypothetical protein